MAIFHLRIQKLDGAEKYRVLTDGVPPQEINFVPYATFDIDVKRLYLRKRIGNTYIPDVHGYLDIPSQEQACTRIGEQLFNGFLPGAIGQKLREGRQLGSPPRIALHLPGSLYNLPWEVLRDPLDPGGQFLSVQGSVVRYDADSPHPNDALFQPESAITLLFMLANPEDMPIPQFEPIGLKRVTFQSVDPATFDNFQSATHGKQAAALGMVFFGHGSIDSNYGVLNFVRPKLGRTFLGRVSDPKRGYSVADAVGVDSPLRLACLFACESAWAGGDLGQSGFQNSIAGALLNRTWLLFVIGQQTPVDYFAAREFFDCLLVEIERGKPLDLAMGRSRIAVRALDPKASGTPYSCLDWWVPVLYAKTANFEILTGPDEQTLPKLPETPLPSGLPTGVVMIPSSGGDARASLRVIGSKLTNLFGSEREQVRKIVRS